MKTNISNGILALSALAAFTACADEKFAEYKTEKPASIAEYEYLDAYAPLKSYITPDAGPDFKLGLALGAADFNQKGQVYTLALNNFQEIVAGNAMKYASCVGDNGSMNFATVQDFVSTAKAAGLSIYGHTLAWHSQQNLKYLKSILADKELPPVEMEGYCMHIQTSEAKANPWDWQCFYDVATPLKAGVAYSFSMKTKASAAVSFPFWIETPGAGNTHYGMPQVSAGTTWGDVAFDFTPNSDCSRLLFNFGQFGGDLYFDDMKLVEVGSEENLIENGDFEKGKLTAAWSKPGWHGHVMEVTTPPVDVSTTIDVPVWNYDFSDGTPLAGWGGGMVLGVEDGVATADIPNTGNFWESQINFEPGSAYTNGTKYTLTMKVKGSKEGLVRPAFQNPDGYKGCGDFPNVKVTTEWQDVKVSATVNGDNALRLLFSVGDFGGKLYFDDIALTYEKSANSIPLTDQEKKDTLNYAMDQWIGGMMKACGGYVKAWDVVNEAIGGGGDDGEGNYTLQHADSPDDNGVKGENFYWQDIMGDLEYVRTAVALARKHYEANEGNPADLKLFINDYNLESDWDDNKKLKSLINWIAKWEADGVTKIDGIGTQMHVSCYANEAIQKSKQEHVTKMFELMAATGKLIKVSELDMGYVDADGNDVLATDMTLEQHKAMADYYKFIVSEYFRIIPAAQQYSITQWCATDAPADSGWRKGQPVGLWDLNYNRKPAYAGFAEGLSGK